MKQAFAEFLGTFMLVLIGCGAAASMNLGPGTVVVDGVGVGLAFGFAFVAAASAIGVISGCHINPAVSFGFLVAGRIDAPTFLRYAVGQMLGGIVAACTLYMILSGREGGWNGNLGQNLWGHGVPDSYGMASSFFFETLGTFLFMATFLGATSGTSATRMRGVAALAIGCTIVALHIAGMNISNVSINPARSFGPALIGLAADPLAFKQVWLFVIGPLAGAGIAGTLYKSGVLRPGEDPDGGDTADID